MHFPPIRGMNNFAIPSHKRQPLKTLNRLTIPHTLTSSGDNTYSIRFQEYGPKHLVANGRYCYCFPKRVHFNQFQKQISKRAACLPPYINGIHAVGQQFVLVAKYPTSLFLVPFQKLGALIDRHKVYP